MVYGTEEKQGGGDPCKGIKESQHLGGRGRKILLCRVSSRIDRAKKKSPFSTKKDRNEGGRDGRKKERQTGRLQRKLKGF